MPIAVTPAPPRLALVGDRRAEVAAHARIPRIVRGLAEAAEPVETYWLGSDEITGDDDLVGFDGVWLVPGSPYRSTAGALAAVRAAREHAIPFLGTCGGFQHALLELLRDVCGIADAEHAETSPGATRLAIVPLACSLVGGEGRIDLQPGSRAAALLGATSTLERYHCSYGLDPAYEAPLAVAGLAITGRDESGAPRIAELAGHPFFLATLFQPELSSDERWAHPLIRAFVAAARERSAARVPA